MLCQDLEQVLEQWPPESLPAEAAAHVQTCVNCQALVADLEAIQEAGARMGEADRELAPPEHVWRALRAQLQAEGLVRGSEPAHVGWLTALWSAIPRPALAGALALVLIAAALGVYRTLAPSADPAAARIETQLNAAEKGTVRALPQSDPALAADVRHNLEVVDKFISLCEKSVREDPQNQLAREYLYDAYQQKAELLSAMMERGEAGD